MRDPERLFERLAASPFRSRFRLGRKERGYLSSRGWEAIKAHAAEFVATRLSAAEPTNDGKQTPYRGHPVFIAQHATATCCRSCLEKWHGVTTRRPLSDEEQAEIVSIIMSWLRREI